MTLIFGQVPVPRIWAIENVNDASVIAVMKLCVDRKLVNRLVFKI